MKDRKAKHGHTDASKVKEKRRGVSLMTMFPLSGVLWAYMAGVAYSHVEGPEIDPQKVRFLHRMFGPKETMKGRTFHCARILTGISR
jgi:hypothetical protein